jgi:predicted GIY-YIG superfamily endonuclease
MSTYYIYKVTNKFTGLSYVGKTENFGRRVSQHISHRFTEDSIFHNALQEFDLRAFKWEVVDITDDYADAVEKEKYYIKTFNTIVPNGYNESYNSGGAPCTRPVVCLSRDGALIKKYDYLEQVKDDGYDITSVRRNLGGNRYLTRGQLFMWLDEYEKNGPKKYERALSSSRKPIVQCSRAGGFINRFDSVTEASDATGVRRATISGNLTGKYKSAGGFIFVYESEYPIKDIDAYKKRGKGVPVEQIDVGTGCVIHTFASMKEAADSVNGDHRNIQKVADKPNRTAYGYKWKRSIR